MVVAGPLSAGSSYFAQLSGLTREQLSSNMKDEFESPPDVVYPDRKFWCVIFPHRKNLPPSLRSSGVFDEVVGFCCQLPTEARLAV